MFLKQMCHNFKIYFTDSAKQNKRVLFISHKFQNKVADMN